MISKLTGIVTDFKGNPLNNADVKIFKAFSFDPIYETQTDIDGRYFLDVEHGEYMALVALYEYGIKYLENWNWQFQIYENLEVNMRIGEIEVYSINAFVPQGSPPPKVLIYFRPCSFKKYLQNKHEIENTLIDWTCFGTNINNCDLLISIDDENVAVSRIDQITEKCGDNNVLCYLIQVTKPPNMINDKVCKIKIAIHDNETNEDGEGTLYVKFNI